MSEIVIRHVETTDAQALHHLYSQTPVYRDTLQLRYRPSSPGRSASPIPNQARITWRPSSTGSLPASWPSC